MKRIRAIKLLALVFVLVLLLSSCDTGRESLLSKNNITIVNIWHYYNGPQKQSFDELVKEFNETVGAQKGIAVVATSKGYVDELRGLVLDSVEQKVGAEPLPEMFAAYADTAYDVYLRGMIADIGDYLTDAEKQSYVSYYLYEGGLPDGKILVFPIAKSTELLSINKTDWETFKEACGVSEAELATWEGLAEAARIYHEWTDSLTPDIANDGKAFFGRDAMGNYMLVGASQLGSNIFSVGDDGSVTLNCDKAVMRKLWDNYYVPYINGYYAAYGKFRSDDMKTGDLIAYVGSSSGAAYFPSTVTKEDGSSYEVECLVLPLPGFEGTKSSAVQQGAGLTITKTDERREYASSLFLKWFTEPEQNLRFALASGYMPVKTDANDWDYVSGFMADNDMSVIDSVEQTLHVGLDMVKTYELYTSDAFEGGNDARDILTAAMSDKANEDLAAIAELIAGGMPKGEAVAMYDNDDNFDAWYDSVVSRLEKIIN